jgi:hypothetical protein
VGGGQGCPGVREARKRRVMRKSLEGQKGYFVGGMGSFIGDWSDVV